MADQVDPPAGASNTNEVAELGTGGRRDDESVEQYMLRLQEEAAELRALLASERQERDQLARAAPGASTRARSRGSSEAPVAALDDPERALRRRSSAPRGSRNADQAVQAAVRNITAAVTEAAVRAVASAGGSSGVSTLRRRSQVRLGRPNSGLQPVRESGAAPGGGGSEPPSSGDEEERPEQEGGDRGRPPAAERDWDHVSRSSGRTGRGSAYEATRYPGSALGYQDPNVPRPSATPVPKFAGDYDVWSARFEVWAGVQGFWHLFERLVPRPEDPSPDASAEEKYDQQQLQQQHDYMLTRAFDALLSAVEKTDYSRLLLEFKGRNGQPHRVHDAWMRLRAGYVRDQ